MCHRCNTGVEWTLNKSQHTKLTLEKKILLLLRPGFELATFQSQVHRSVSRAGNSGRQNSQGQRIEEFFMMYSKGCLEQECHASAVGCETGIVNIIYTVSLVFCFNRCHQGVCRCHQEGCRCHQVTCRCHLEDRLFR